MYLTVLYCSHQIINSLQGKYGFKRFHRDGYGTVLEDKKRRYYHIAETKVCVSIYSPLLSMSNCIYFALFIMAGLDVNIIAGNHVTDSKMTQPS